MQNQMTTSTWQPTTTAPKDGTTILIHVPNSDHRPIREARWESDHTNGYWRTDLCIVFPESVSEWMPLPTPPHSISDQSEPIGYLRLGSLAEDFYTTKASERLEAGVWHPVYSAAPDDTALLHRVLDTLRAARSYHGVYLMSNPPKDAWTYHDVNGMLDDAIDSLIVRLGNK